MLLKTIDKDGEITLKEYDRKEYRGIMQEKNDHVLKRINYVGDDYGGSHHSEETTTRYDEISESEIVVQDGHFAGVLIVEDYDYYNGGSELRLNDHFLRVQGKPNDKVRCGFSFANDDHDRWDYTDTYLVRRPEDK